jgi:gamma-glutamylcyclotransferase (GGCT)/AIG2-like uncharacterized protein YtfP
MRDRARQLHSVARTRHPTTLDVREAVLLYFAYTARIAPERMSEVAPGAEFQFIAHLPQTGLEWPIENGTWGGGLPTVMPDETSTVWGAVFSVPEEEFGELDAIESEEGRNVAEIEAMDRTGKRHLVTVHMHKGNGSSYTPSRDYVSVMLRGSRHWSLPAGWIAGLEEHLDGAF